MIILHDPDTFLHETVELLGAKVIAALESPERIRAIISTVRDSHHDLKSIISPLRAGNAASPDLTNLLQVISSTHDSGYLQHLYEVFGQWRAAGLIKENESVFPECFTLIHSARSKPRIPTDIYARAGYYAFDMSSAVMSQTYTSTIASANLAYQAVQELKSGSAACGTIFALTRPPGHHCDGYRAGGYCYVNNAAVAVSAWRHHVPDSRIAILDIDFHHGNGTQEIYYHNPDVFYTSIHGENEFPYYSGFADETGGPGRAEGTTLNLPLRTGSSFAEYLVKLDLAIDALAKHDPQFLLVSLGFDTFHLDPLGGFKIETEDYETMAKRTRQGLKDIPAVILLEGGYVLEHLGANVLAFIRGWEGAGRVRNGVAEA